MEDLLSTVETQLHADRMKLACLEKVQRVLQQLKNTTASQRTLAQQQVCRRLAQSIHAKKRAALLTCVRQFREDESQTIHQFRCEKRKLYQHMARLKMDLRHELDEQEWTMFATSVYEYVGKYSSLPLECTFA
mgnify:CR=1 FL=1